MAFLVIPAGCLACMSLPLTMMATPPSDGNLPFEVNPLFQQWLETHFPERAQRVMSRVREMRGGKDYDSDFSKRMHGEGVWADLIRQRFTKTVERLGLAKLGSRFDRLDTTQFRRPLVVPAAPGKAGGKVAGQLDLF